MTETDTATEVKTAEAEEQAVEPSVSQLIDAKVAVALERCKLHSAHLKRKIQLARQKNMHPLTDYVERETGAKETASLRMYERRQLVGHTGKVYAIGWAGKRTRMVSASQDGQLMVWDTMFGTRDARIPLRSAWVMTAGLNKAGDRCLCGGLDNLISIFDVGRYIGVDDPGLDPLIELPFHEGYVSDAQFIDEGDRILSASGDSSAVLWSVEKQCPISVFEEHTMDVESVDYCEETSLVLTGACEGCCALWDIREPRKGLCVGKFKDYLSDVNDARWFKDNRCFLSGSDDSSAVMRDSRYMSGKLNTFVDPNQPGCVSAVTVSHSGRFAFVSYDENPWCLVYDTLTAERVQSLDHNARVSRVRIAPDGTGVASGCWDFSVRIWF